MFKYFDDVTSTLGEPISGVVVTVFTYPALVAQTVYEDDEVTPKTVTTNSDGEYNFNINAGTYTIVHTYNGVVIETREKVSIGAVTDVAAAIVAAAAKTTPAAADSFGMVDSAAGNALKEITWAQLLLANRTPNVQTVVSAATITPTFDNDIVLVTAQAAAVQFLNPTGTAIPNLGMVLRIKDNGTARAITYDTQYRAIGVTLPTTTVINKTTYLAMIYNATDTRWDVIATGTEA